MKPWKATVFGGGSFIVMARTIEAARAAAVNIAAILYLEHGLVLRIQEVVEV